MPSLFSFPNHVYMAITEAAVRDYAGMYLWKENGTLLGKLSPKLGQERIKVEASLPHQSPWRVLMISDQIGSLIASNILTNLNEPCKIEDTSWIKPGKTTLRGGTEMSFRIRLSLAETISPRINITLIS